MLARAHAGERRDRVVLLEQHVGLGRVVVRPVDLGRVGAGVLQRHHRPVVLGRVARAQGVEVGLDVAHELLATGRAEQRRCGGHRPGRVLDPHHGAVVLLVDLDRGVGARGGRTADEERDLEAQALHLRGEVDHLVQRRRDQAGQADDVGAVLLRRVEDLLGRDHHAEVDHLVVVALQDDADDVLADVVDVALDRRHDDRAVGVLLGRERGVLGLLLLDEGDQVGHGLLHDAGALDHLRQEHLAGAEQVADDVHAVHQRTLDDLDRPAAAAAISGAASSVSASTWASMPLTRAWVIRSRDAAGCATRPRPPRRLSAATL